MQPLSGQEDSRLRMSLRLNPSPTNHNVYSACVASCRLLQRQPLVFTIDVVILAYAARMGIVFIFQLEHHFASSVAGTFRQSVYTYSYFRLAVTAHWRQLTPVGLALHFPFAFGIQHQCLRVSVVQCAYRRRTAYQLVMSGNAFKLIPASGCLILWDCDSGTSTVKLSFGTPSKAPLAR